MSGELKEGVFSTMSAHVPLTTLVGDRIYPDAASEEEPLPYITYQAPIETGSHHQEGVNPLALTEIQFTIWAKNGVERSAVQKVLRELFDGKIRQTFGTVFCQSVRNTNNTDTKDDPDDGSQNFAFGVFMDFNFWHNR